MVHLMKALKVISFKDCGGWCLSTTKFRVSQYEEQYSGGTVVEKCSSLHYTRLHQTSVQECTVFYPGLPPPTSHSQTGLRR